MPSGAVTLRSRRIPATAANGFSSSFQVRSSAGTASVSLTDGASKKGVTMAISPSRGITTAVRRSLRHHSTPVKYTIDAPGSMSSAPMPCSPMSFRAWSMRARYSSRPIGLTSPVIFFNAPASAAHSPEGALAPTAAAAAPNFRASRRFMTGRLIFLVRLFLDDARAQRRVDALLDGGAFVVGDVHRTRQLDELLLEAPGALLVADLVLDHPEFFVDAREAGFLGGEVRGG